MPEGDTVHRLAGRMAPLVGRRITYSQFRTPALATASLTGATVEAVWAWGKHLYWRVAPLGRKPEILHTHLRMDGTWLIREAARSHPPDHRTRVVLRVTGEPDPAREVELQGRELGMLDLWPAAQYAERTAHLGPDPLADDWDRPGRWSLPGRDESLTRLRALGPQPIHTAMQDQRVVAGIGNEYANETAFLLGLHPLTPVHDIGAARLLDRATALMQANAGRTLRTFTGIDRDGERTFVFGRNHRPCRRCGTRIQQGTTPMARSVTDTTVDQERVIWWCPRCQPET